MTLRRLLPALFVCALALPAGARAAEPKGPSKALQAYGLGWIQRLPPDAFPPTKYAVCIVDNGVAVTPDTPADDPNGPIVQRLSVYGQSVVPTGTTPEELHGTRMAMAAVAPRNGWGAVGLNPYGRVRSIKATPDGSVSFSVPGFTRAINSCLTRPSEYPVAAISLSLGCLDCAVSDGDVAQLERAVSRARAMGVAVFAAAGNTSGPVQFPANISGVTAIAAGGQRGRLCKYAAWDTRAFVIAPACPVIAAEPLSGALEPRADGGSSVATAEMAAFVAALRTLRPDIASSADVITWISASARQVRGRPVLSGRDAARAAGLGNVLRRTDTTAVKSR